MGKVKLAKDKDPSKWGRPTKFTDDCIRKLQEIFMEDGTVTEACLYAWVSTNQYYERLKVDQSFADKMKQAQTYAFILAKKTLVKSMKSDNEAVAQKGAVEFLKRRDKRYADKVEGNIDVDAEVKADVDLSWKTMVELEQKRKSILWFK